MKLKILGMTVLLLRIAGAAAQQRPVEPVRSAANAENRVEVRVDEEWRELLSRLPDSVRMTLWNPSTVIVGGHILAPLPESAAELPGWTMPAERVLPEQRGNFGLRAASGWFTVSNGNAYRYNPGWSCWGVGIYPGAYLDARTLSFPLPRR